MIRREAYDSTRGRSRIRRHRRLHHAWLSLRKIASLGASHQRDRANARIPGDVFVFRDQGPAFQIEVGGANKRIDAEIHEMRARLLPGFQPLVILYRNGAVRSADVTYYLSRPRKFETIDALIEGAGANA